MIHMELQNWKDRDPVPERDIFKVSQKRFLRFRDNLGVKLANAALRIATPSYRNRLDALITIAMMHIDDLQQEAVKEQMRRAKVHEEIFRDYRPN